MKKSIAILIMLMLAICVIPFGTSDVDADDTMHFRISNVTLFHASGTARSDMTFSEINVIIYEKGQDSSMKAYIDDPDHMATPGEGVRTVVQDQEYDLYYYGMFYPDTYFILTEPENVILPSYSYKTVIGENTTKIITAKSIKTGMSDWKTDIYVFVENKSESSSSYVTKTLLENMTMKLGYEKDGYVEFEAPYVDNTLYMDVTLDVQTIYYDASPIPFVIASIAIILIIGGLIAYCGRKPKFD